MAGTKKRALPCIPRAIPAYNRYDTRFDLTGEVTVGGWVYDGVPPFLPHLQGTQVTESESHDDWKGQVTPPGDIGGNFTTTKQYATLPEGEVKLTSPWIPQGVSYPPRSYRHLYKGPIAIQEAFEASKASFPPFAMSSETALTAYGSKAVSLCAPTRPTVNLATSLLEVYHEGLPKLIGRDTWETRTAEALDYRRRAKSGSSEFLNYQFGWLPIVSDVRDFVSAVVNMDKLLQQYVRDNGNVVRRRLALPPSVSVEESVVRARTLPRLSVNGDYYDFSQPRGDVVRRRETSVRRWFSGAFVYHLPHTFFAEVYTPFADKFQVYRKVLGLELTPETIWQLAPWSWAIDWFTNVGDVISNASTWALDGLVMKYGYVMEHSIVRDTLTYVGPIPYRDRSCSQRPPDVTLVSEAKLRRAANPFGFGLTMEGLTALQKTILAAVGISRMR